MASSLSLPKKIKSSPLTLLEYLQTLPRNLLGKLFIHPATCLAVFREVPELGRHFILRMLSVDQPVPQAIVSSWTTPIYLNEANEACQVLSDLQLWQQVNVPGGLPAWNLNPVFKTHLKQALFGGGKPWAVFGSLEKNKHSRTPAFLDSYCLERWECVLHFMVGSQQANEGISADAIKILIHASLMKRDDSDDGYLITKEGFQFLLMNTSTQVWNFMLKYLDILQNQNFDLAECLSFLLQLSFSTMGKDYSTVGMSDNLLIMLQHLREFGLVYQRKRKSGRFYPTRLAINLATGLNSLDLDTHRPGFLVVETNYHVFAYTESNLQVALLGLFCEMMYRFPNLAVGLLTRDSVRQALRGGITSSQIVGYLRLHAHPKMLNQNPIIPPTISDQISLWELERDRFLFTEGVLYNQFLSAADFELLRNYARDLGVLIWDNPSKRVMVVSRTGHDDVKKFWKRNRST